MRPPAATPIAAVLLIVALALPGAATAQLPGALVTLEARGTAALAAGDFASSRPGLDAGAGAGFVAGARVGVAEAVEVYGLYRAGRFRCDGCADAGLDSQVTEAGFEAGVRASLPFSTGGLGTWASAGGLVAHELAIPGGGGELVSDPALGLAVGAGIEVPLFGGPLALSPGLHYRRYTATIDFEGLTLEDPFGDGEPLSGETDVSHVSLELGFTYGF